MQGPWWIQTLPLVLERDSQNVLRPICWIGLASAVDNHRPVDNQAAHLSLRARNPGQARGVEGRTAEGKFEEREKIFGFDYNKHGLLWDPWLAVDIASTVMFDWMHIYLVGGLCHVSSSVTCVSFGVW